MKYTRLTWSEGEEFMNSHICPMNYLIFILSNYSPSIYLMSLTEKLTLNRLINKFMWYFKFKKQYATTNIFKGLKLNLIVQIWKWVFIGCHTRKKKSGHVFLLRVRFLSIIIFSLIIELVKFSFFSSVILFFCGWFKWWAIKSQRTGFFFFFFSP